MQWNKDFLDKIPELHVLVVGDLMLDRYLYGSVDRISPEAPVPILNLKSSESLPGGAANVAMNFAGLGCRTTVIGCVGNDDRGAMLIRILNDKGIATSHIRKVDGWPTTTKTRVIGGHQHILRVDEETQLALTPAHAQELQDEFETCVAEKRPDAVVIQDYNKGLLSAEMIAFVIQTARDAGIPVMVDPKNENFFAYQGVNLFKPNLRELAVKVPFPIDTTVDALRKACVYVREQLGHEMSCITLSEHGIFIDAGGHSALYPTTPRDVADVCGAGDAVLSILTLGYLCGLGPDEFAHLANAAGGIVCEETGVAPVTKERLMQELRENFL